MTNVVVCIWNDPPQAQAFQHFVLSCWYHFFVEFFLFVLGFVLFCFAKLWNLLYMGPSYQT